MYQVAWGFQWKDLYWSETYTLIKWDREKENWFVSVLSSGTSHVSVNQVYFWRYDPPSSSTYIIGFAVGEYHTAPVQWVGLLNPVQWVGLL